MDRKALAKTFAYGILVSFFFFYLVFFRQSIQMTFAASTNVAIRLGLNLIFASTFVPFSPEHVAGSIQINSGWNLISFPFADSVGVAGTCDPSILNFYSYNASTGVWKSTNNAPGVGGGSWVYSTQACSMQYTGAFPISSINLAPGWNQIGTFSVPRGANSLFGNCTFIQGPLNYTPNGSWQNSTVLIPGAGYWMQVNQPCYIS